MVKGIGVALLLAVREQGARAKGVHGQEAVELFLFLVGEAVQGFLERARTGFVFLSSSEGRKGRP